MMIPLIIAAPMPLLLPNSASSPPCFDVQSYKPSSAETVGLPLETSFSQEPSTLATSRAGSMLADVLRAASPITMATSYWSFPPLMESSTVWNNLLIQIF
jgi:hypothetical protein